MLYRDFDNKLDMQFEVSTKVSDPFVTLLEKEDQVIPAVISSEEGSTVLDLYLKRELVAHLGGALKTLNPVRKDEYYVVRMPKDRIETGLQVSNGLTDILSSCLCGMYLKRGRLFLRVAFHNTEIKKVSRLLSTGMKKSLDSRIEYIGPSSGGIEHLKNISSVMRLSLIAFEFSSPVDQSDYIQKDHYANISVQYLRKEDVNAIIYPNKSDDWKGLSTSISDGIFSSKIKGLMTDPLFHSAMEQRIPIFACILRITGRTVGVFLFVPRIFKQEFLNNIFNSIPKSTYVNFRLLAVRDYDNSIWDWI